MCSGSGLGALQVEIDQRLKGIKEGQSEGEITLGVVGRLWSIIFSIKRENIGKLLIWRNVDIERLFRRSSVWWEDETGRAGSEPNSWQGRTSHNISNRLSQTLK